MSLTKDQADAFSARLQAAKNWGERTPILQEVFLALGEEDPARAFLRAVEVAQIAAESAQRFEQRRPSWEAQTGK